MRHESGEVIEPKLYIEPGAEINLLFWKEAAQTINKARRIKDVLSISIAGQQHSMVTVDHQR